MDINDPATPPTLPFSQNINWTQLLGLIATVLALFGINLDPHTQAAIILLIVSATSLVTWVMHTFVNHPNNVQSAQAMAHKAVQAAKRAAPIFLFMLILPMFFTLAACGWLTDQAANVAVATVSNTPIPGQAKTVFGAETTFDFLVREAQHYVDSGAATPAVKSGIHNAVVKAHAVIKQARAAAEAGTNAGTATLLASLNAANLDFASALSRLGVPIPQ
jgi:hypothetical protein